jgi:hypothetical protein
MNNTARMVMKIIGASLALAAVVCLLIGAWDDLSAGVCKIKERLSKKKQCSEFDDYADDEL